MSNKKEVYKGFANHYRKLLFEGGKLFLYDDELVFKPYFFNLSRKPITIPLNKIKAVDIESFFLLGPNLYITLLGGEEIFSVFYPKVWCEYIRQQINKYRHQKNTASTIIKQINSSDKESHEQSKHKRKLEL